MSLFISALASGSNGNCYYIGNENEAVLVDVGIPCREVEKRMKRIGLAVQKIKAIFVSHEHTDHIRGISVFAKRNNLPVYVSTPTLQGGGFYLDNGYTRSFTGYQNLSVGELIITPFPKLHDAVDPFSFIVTYKEVRVGVFTDIGTPCQHVIQHFSQCHAAFLESNYDEDMLEKGNYPYYLKKRIRGDRGHLSNRQALALFRKHRPSFMSHLILSHLSRNNNSPELVEELFRAHAGGVHTVVASRYKETEVYRINSSLPSTPIHYTPVSNQQLELCFE